MSEKVGRNDPCPCGSGKKYKSCCIKIPTGKKKFTATILTQPKGGIDLLERTFGNAIAKGKSDEKPPAPTEGTNENTSNQ